MSKTINHDTTKARIIAIGNVLRAQAVYARDYKKQCVNITVDDMMTQKYKDEKLKTLRESYDAKHNETKVEIVKLLNEIAEIEAENEAVYSVDGFVLNNTLALIQTTKGDLPEEVVDGMVKTFNGNYLAARAIRAAFEAFGAEETALKFKDCTTTAYITIDALLKKAENLEYSADTTVISLRNLLNDAVRFGETRGIVFSDAEKKLGDGLDETAIEYMARREMGLPVE